MQTESIPSGALRTVPELRTTGRTWIFKGDSRHDGPTCHALDICKSEIVERDCSEELVSICEVPRKGVCDAKDEYYFNGHCYNLWTLRNSANKLWNFSSSLTERRMLKQRMPARTSRMRSSWLLLAPTRSSTMRVVGLEPAIPTMVEWEISCAVRDALGGAKG